MKEIKQQEMENLRQDMLKLQEEKKEARLKLKKVQNDLKHQLQGQLEEIEELKMKAQEEREKEKRLQEMKNSDLHRILMEEKENERQTKKHLGLDISNYIKSENCIKQLMLKAEKEEEEKRKIYKSTAEFLEKKITEKGKIKDSEKKFIGLKVFEEISQIKDKEREVEEEKIKQEEIEIKKTQIKELLKFRKKREQLRQEVVEDRKKAEEEKVMKNEKKRIEKNMEIREREERQKFDKLWNAEEEKKAKEKQRMVREDYWRQWKEKELMKQEEKDWEKLFVISLEEDNKNVAKYCDYILEQTEQHKRPLFPVLKAIKDVKADCQIIKSKKLNDHLISKVSINHGRQEF